MVISELWLGEGGNLQRTVLVQSQSHVPMIGVQECPVIGHPVLDHLQQLWDRQGVTASSQTSPARKKTNPSLSCARMTILL